MCSFKNIKLNPTIHIEPNHSFDSIWSSIPFESHIELKPSQIHHRYKISVSIITDKLSSFYESLSIYIENGYESRLRIISNEKPNETLFFIVHVFREIISETKLNENQVPIFNTFYYDDLSNDSEIYDEIIIEEQPDLLSDSMEKSNEYFQICYLHGSHGFKIADKSQHNYEESYLPIEFTPEIFYFKTWDPKKYELVPNIIIKNLKDNSLVQIQSDLHDDLSDCYLIIKSDDSYYFIGYDELHEHQFIYEFVRESTIENQVCLKRTNSIIIKTQATIFGIIDKNIYSYFYLEHMYDPSIIKFRIIDGNKRSIELTFTKTSDLDYDDYRFYVWKDFNGDSHILFVSNKTIILIDIELTTYHCMFEMSKFRFINQGILVVTDEKNQTYMLKSPNEKSKFYLPKNEETDVHFNELGQPEFIYSNFIEMRHDRPLNCYIEYSFNLCNVKKDVGHNRLWFLCSLLL